MRDYSPVATYRWTSTSATGSYIISATVRSIGSGVERQTQAEIPYSITPPASAACTNATLSASPANTQVVNQPVVLTASVRTAPTCNPEYRFWVFYPSNAPAPYNSGWNIVRDYNSTPTYSWSTSVAGSYTFAVTVRGAGFNVERQTDAYLNYGVTAGSAACTGGTLSASPANSQTVNLPVTMTGGVANAAACVPEYRFWVYFPGSAPAPYTAGWNVVRDYSSSNTYSFTATSVAGDYTFAVTVRAAGSGAYDQTDAYLDYSIGPVSPGHARVQAPRIPPAPTTSPAAPAVPSAPPAGPR